jgi:hypothetical protein
MSRPIDIRDLESRTALTTDKRVSLDADGNLLNTNQPDNSAIGTAASKNVGTAATEIPLNSDLGSASTKDTGTASTNVPLNSDLGFLFSANNLMIVQDQQSSNTDGGTFTSGSYIRRVLNTVLTNTITGASLAGNLIALPAGLYYIVAEAPAFKVDRHKIKITDSTNSADLLIGSSSFTSNNDSIQTISKAMGIINLAGAASIEILHRCQLTKIDNGYGLAASFSDTNVYTSISIYKVG